MMISYLYSSGIDCFCTPAPHHSTLCDEIMRACYGLYCLISVHQIDSESQYIIRQPDANDQHAALEQDIYLTEA